MATPFVAIYCEHWATWQIQVRGNDEGPKLLSSVSGILIDDGRMFSCRLWLSKRLAHNGNLSHDTLNGEWADMATVTVRQTARCQQQCSSAAQGCSILWYEHSTIGIPRTLGFYSHALFVIQEDDDEEDDDDNIGEDEEVDEEDE